MVGSGSAALGLAVVERNGKAAQVLAVMVGHVSVRYVWVRCGLARRFRFGRVRRGVVC